MAHLQNTSMFIQKWLSLQKIMKDKTEKKKVGKGNVGADLCVRPKS
jgi:hypothetical protein